MWHTSSEIGVLRSNSHGIFKKERFSPYKLQELQRLTEDDSVGEYKCANRHSIKMGGNEVLREELYVNKEVNEQKLIYLPKENPDWFSGSKEKEGDKPAASYDLCNMNNITLLILM
jgi:hypothetical protein